MKYQNTFFKEVLTEWSNLQNRPNVIFLVYSSFTCCCLQKVSTPYSKGVAVASSAAQLLIQSALKWYKYSCFACMAAKGKLSYTVIVLKAILKIPALRVFTTL